MPPCEMAPQLTGHGFPLSKWEAYNRVYDYAIDRVEVITSVQPRRRVMASEKVREGSDRRGRASSPA